MVADILSPQSFYREAHQKIFEAMSALAAQSEPIDILTVTNQLRKDGSLEFCGGNFYVMDLTNRVSSAANIEAHARKLQEHALKRELISISSEINRHAFEDTTDVFELLDKAEHLIYKVSESSIRKDYTDMATLTNKAFEELRKRANQKDDFIGVQSGFTRLDRLTSGWQKSTLVIIAARPGMGKCLGKGTKVLMYDGSLKKVEDVQTGDVLMGNDSTPRNVLSIARGQEKMYWIRQNQAQDYRVNESHILSLKRSRTEGPHQSGEVLNISVHNYLKRSDKFKTNYKGYKTAVEFTAKELPLDPYFLGLWLGDGDINSPRITTQAPEVVSYLEEYAHTLTEHGHLATLSTYDYSNRCNPYAITKGSRGKQEEAYSIKKELRKIGVLGHKHIPQEYLVNNTDARLALLAGLIDSDGHYLEQSNGYEITQSREDLARQIKFLCDTLGFKTSFTKKKAGIAAIGYQTDVFCIRIYGDIDKVPVKIERKKARPPQSNWQVTDISVEYDKVDDYYGFEIDGNHLFLLEDMTVTHNTAFILSAVRNAALQFKKPVAFFSLEMSSVELTNRMFCAEAELDSQKIKNGKLEEYEWQKLYHRAGPLAEAPIFIDDTPAISIMELRTKCRRLKSQHDIQMIVIDYLQLMNGNTGNNKNTNREQEIGTISRSLKELSKELDIPVIALAQLSRSVETRGGEKRPQLSDLRESGSIEQDADMVMFLYRPDYYGVTQDEMGASVEGICELIIAKHRSGGLDTIPLRFIKEFTKFTDADYQPAINGLASFSDDGVGTISSRLNSDPPAGQLPPQGDPFGEDDDDGNPPF